MSELERSLAETREFFTPRAAGWEDRFPDDDPLFEAAVAALELVSGQAALDAGCGTGRALPMLRAAVGPAGRVVGVDATPAMLEEARRLGRHEVAELVVGDVTNLDLTDGSMDGVLAAGLLPHLPDAVATLWELHRVTRSGARLAVFHPVGRVALAGRHGSDPDAMNIAPGRITPLLASTGWKLTTLHDDPHRYLAVAVRAD